MGEPEQAQQGSDGLTVTVRGWLHRQNEDESTAGTKRFRGRKGALVMVPEMRARFLAMQIPGQTIDRTLSGIQRPDDWIGAWQRAAQEFMGAARREDAAGRWHEAAIARRNMAMCYHIAHLVTDEDPRTVRALRAASVQAFALSAPKLYPETRKVAIEWRARELPAYLAKPAAGVGEEGAPLLVLLNGASTSKEELFLWAWPLTKRGIAVLTLDWPGTGEAVDGTPLSAECEDLTDGLFAFIASEPGLAIDKVAIAGISLGSVVAVRAAVTDRRISACIVITPPFDSSSWARSISPAVARQLVSLAGQAAGIEGLLNEFSMGSIVNRLRTPILIFGAGSDRVIPAVEAQYLAASAEELATLVWYPDGNHGLYDRVSDWVDVAGEWLQAIYAAAPESTRVESDNPATPE